MEGRHSRDRIPVERSLSATTGFAALSPQAPQNAVSYDDPGRSTTSFYRVRAVGQKNATSPYSSVVSVQVPAAGDTSPPAPAPTVSFSNVSCNAVTANWTASSDPQSGIGGNGAYVWSKRLGAAIVSGQYYNSNALGVAVNGNDDVTVTRWFESTVDFGGTSLTVTGYPQYPDVFVAQYKTDGSLRWVKRFGGTSNDGWQLSVGGNIAVDPATNDVVTTGSFTSNPADFAGGNLANAGDEDAYLVRLRS